MISSTKVIWKNKVENLVERDKGCSISQEIPLWEGDIYGEI